MLRGSVSHDRRAGRRAFRCPAGIHRASAPALGTTAPAASRTSAPALLSTAISSITARTERPLGCCSRVSCLSFGPVPSRYLCIYFHAHQPAMRFGDPAQRSVAPSGQCKYLLPAHYPEQGPGAGSALPVCSRCAQSPARPWQHRIPPGSASVTAGTTREATASSARGSSPISTHRPRRIPLPGSCLLQTKAGEGRESKRKAREKGAGAGGQCKLARRETVAFWREMLPTAGAASGMLPGGHPARGTERAQATRTSRRTTTLFKPALRLRHRRTSFLEGRAMARTLGDRGGSRAGHWERDVPPQQLCLVSSLQTALTTQHVYTGANDTLLLPGCSSSAAVAAQSPCGCVQRCYLLMRSHCSTDRCAIQLQSCTAVISYRLSDPAQMTAALHP